MKPLYFIILFALLAVCHGCQSPRIVQSSRPLRDNNEPTDLVTIITVDCRNEAAVKDMVVQLLRTVRVTDLDIRNNGSYLDIEAKYREITDVQLADIEQHLRQSGGVLTVEIKKDRIPLKNP